VTVCRHGTGESDAERELSVAEPSDLGEAFRPRQNRHQAQKQHLL